MRLIDAEYLLYGMGVFSEKENGTEFMKGVDAVDKMIEDAPTIDPFGWIPCSERLPEADGIYLVTYKLKDYGVELLSFSTATYGGGWTIPAPACYTLKNSNIIAWSYKPKSYQGEA